MLRYALFDLDNTLYPAATGLWEAVGERINLYLTERMRFPPAEATALRQQYLAAFGTTLNGLRHNYHIDPHDYLAFVHDLPLARYLRPDPALAAMLARLPLTKVIFTNADAAHARRVLERLGLASHFSRIIDILSLDFVNKPDPRAYQYALAQLGAAPAECLFIDDTPGNLPPAHALGMRTVLIGDTPAPPNGIDYQIADLLEIEHIIQEALSASGIEPEAALRYNQRQATRRKRLSTTTR
jgi:putative hydrolase of the HAD superfamily